MSASRIGSIGRPGYGGRALEPLSSEHRTSANSGSQRLIGSFSSKRPSS